MIDDSNDIPSAQVESSKKELEQAKAVSHELNTLRAIHKTQVINAL